MGIGGGMLLFGGCTKCGGGGLFRSRASAVLLLENTQTVEMRASVPVWRGVHFTVSVLTP